MKDYNAAYNVAKTLYEENFICKKTYGIVLRAMFCNIMEVNVKEFIDLDNGNRKNEYDPDKRI